jgi:hypothetical protein
MSFYWALLYFEAELQATTLFVFLLLVFLLAADRWSRRRTFGTALVMGLVAGAATLVRPNFLAIAAATLAWMVVISRAKPENRRSTLAAAGGLILGTLLAVAPATLRNLTVSGSFVPVSTNSGINLYIGNNPQADGFVMSELPGLGEFGTSFDWPRIVRALGTDDVGADRYFRRESLAFIADNPRRFLALTVKKALLFWGPAEVGHNKELHFERLFSKSLGRLPGNFSLLLALGLTGFVLLVFDRDRERRAAAVLAGAVVAAYFLSVLPFFAAARYRVPLVPPLLLLGAWAVFRFGVALRERRWRAAFAGVVVVLASYLAAGHAWVDYAPSLARWHYDRAVAFEGVGEPQQALEEYRKSLREDVTFFYSRYNIGHLLASLGRFDEAAKQWEAALMARRDYAPTHYNLGLAYLELGDRQKGLAHLERARALKPASAEYRAKVLEVRGNND